MRKVTNIGTTHIFVNKPRFDNYESYTFPNSLPSN